MPAPYRTPGVYLEEIPKFPPSIAPVETAIPAFIGYTEKAIETADGDLELKPKRISSVVEYERFFGTAQSETEIDVTVTENTDKTRKIDVSFKNKKRSKHLLYYCLQLFFANGGGPCYIVSVGKYKTIGGALVGGDIEKGIDAIAKEDEPTLIVIPEAQSLKIAEFNSAMTKALAQCELLKDRFVIMDVHGGDAVSLSNPDTDLLAAVNTFRSDGIGINNLKYGAAYAPNIETVLDLQYKEEDVKITLPAAAAAGGGGGGGGGAAAAQPTLKELNIGTDGKGKDQNTELYEAVKAAIRDISCVLPPSPAMAGIYAAVDSSRGVWKAPANVSVNAVIKPTIQFSHAEQGHLNFDPVAGKSVNAIRPFIGKGTLVWGARTLAGNDNEWRYINVRRLFIFIEESVKKATEQFVFEANDANTWVKVQGMIENFLTTLWRQGALQGVKPEHAFYVAVGLGKTMTALDILEGRLQVEIGLAAVRPAEFIILRFSHKMAES